MVSVVGIVCVIEDNVYGAHVYVVVAFAVVVVGIVGVVVCLCVWWCRCLLC